MAYLLFFILSPLLVGSLILIAGYRTLKRKHRSTSAWQQRRLQYILASWQIKVDTESQIIQDTNKQMSILTTFLRIGMSIGLLLTAIIAVCITLLTSGTLLPATSSIHVDPLGEIVLLLMFAGAWLGQMAGFRTLKRTATRHIAFGDMRRRLASDYRSPLVHVIPLIIIIMNTITIITCISTIHAPVRLLLWNGITAWWPSWTLLIVPVIMLLLIAGVEAVIGNVVRFPRLLVTNDLERAHRIDDMVRSIIIGSMIGSEYTIMGNLQLAYSRLTWMAFSGTPQESIPLYVIWGIISYFLWLALLMVGCVSVTGWEGHIGGTISGWPWRKAIAGRSDGTAIADR